MNTDAHDQAIQDEVVVVANPSGYPMYLYDVLDPLFPGLRFHLDLRVIEHKMRRI